MRYYISGPMAGLPDLNFPAFNAVAERLRHHNRLVVNPAEVALPGGSTPHEFLHADLLTMLRDCNSLILLPGWPQSRGARLELAVASDLHWPIYFSTSEDDYYSMDTGDHYAAPGLP